MKSARYGGNFNPFNNQEGTPYELKNLIIIGSHARAESNPLSTIEGIFIEFNAKTNTFWVTEVDSNGQPLKDSNGNNIKYRLQDCSHPELILDAWSEHPHLTFLLNKAKEYLISKDVIHSTLAKLRKLKSDYLNVYTTGICKFKGIEYPQHIVNENNIIFLFGLNQFGPKYSLIRIIQLTLIIKLIEVYNNKGVNEFFDITTLRPSIENKLSFLLEFDYLLKSNAIEILKLYKRLNLIYHSKVNGLYVPIMEIENCIGNWLKK